MREAGLHRIAARTVACRAARRCAAFVYLTVSAAGHLAWEVAQMPFYTIWTTGSAKEIAVDALHCAAGDVLIAVATAGLALLLLRGWTAPFRRFAALVALTLLLGLAYTVFSEWLNVDLRQSWSYSPLMPVLPPLGTGLLPLLQWGAVPLAALLAARRAGMSRHASASSLRRAAPPS